MFLLRSHHPNFLYCNVYDLVKLFMYEYQHICKSTNMFATVNLPLVVNGLLSSCLRVVKRQTDERGGTSHALACVFCPA